MLDNRRMAMIEDTYIRNYRPLFVIDDTAVMKYSDAPLLASTPEQNAAPVTALNAEPGEIAASN
jgi:hypothetical protein